MKGQRGLEGSYFFSLLLLKESVSFPWLLTLRQPPDSFPVIAIMHAARKREVWWVRRKWDRKTSPLAQASHEPLLLHLARRAGEWNKFCEIENLNCQQSARKVQFMVADKFARIIDDNVFFMKLRVPNQLILPHPVIVAQVGLEKRKKEILLSILSSFQTTLFTIVQNPIHNYRPGETSTQLIFCSCPVRVLSGAHPGWDQTWR